MLMNETGYRYCQEHNDGLTADKPLQSCQELMKFSPVPTSSLRFINVNSSFITVNSSGVVLVEQEWCETDARLDGGGKADVA